MFADPTEMNFVLEVDSEQASVIMGSLSIIAVFATGVVPERAEAFADTFEEFLKVRFVQAAELRQSFVVVRKSDEAILFVELGFVYATKGPLSTLFKATADALSAWERERP